MDLPKQEEQILRFWKQIRAFERSMDRVGLPRAKSRGSFVFYEGPPTANGRPGIHHVLARVFKDIICRYKTMQGYRVERKAGWDTHGLPVEVEVEKELDLHNKKEIEKYGIAKFNEKCRESVWRYKQEWDKLTERIAFWLDLENPYITYEPLYMETLWQIIRHAYDKKLLYEGHKVVPYCPRCGTSLSSHEVAQGYEEVREDSVFVKLRIKGSPTSLKLRGPGQKASFLAWTTTPWTLPGNVALAVGAKIDYVLVKQDAEYYILAKERLDALKGEYKIIKEFKGVDLERVEYEPLFDSLKSTKERKHFVALADFVSTEEGTGIVHTAVMYGEDDYSLGQKLGLPKIHTVDESGMFNNLVPKWEGKFVKDAEPEIIADLASRKLLYKKEPYTHSYPFCWRCKSPLLYYAMRSWFVKMSSLRAELLKNNKTINWIPSHIKEGRFGEWLREVKDWNFSRRRFWGTPLPVWRCGNCAETEVIGSRNDIKKQKFSDNTFFFIRHGESEKNNRSNPIISSRWPEAKKYHLTKTGRVQVKKSARLLKKRGGIDLIFASDFTRAKETAEILAKEFGVKVKYDKRLREYNLGVYDGRLAAEFHKDFPTLGERFKKAPPEGETSAAVQAKMFNFIASVNKKYSNKKILIVSHGDPLWILESRLLGLTIEEAVNRKKVIYPEVGQLRKAVFRNFPYNKRGELDFHRPYVDKISFWCKKCGTENSMQREEDLIDVWFDAGAMPFAQVHWPFAPAFAKASAGRQNKKLVKPKLFPADYISEAVDQTRGWFYSLLAISTFLGLGAPYRNVISLAHVLDKRGKKMSKSMGNIIDPWQMIESYGSDALRWYFYTMNRPGDSKNFDEADLRKTYRKFISTLANTLVFYKIYRSNKSYKTQKTPKTTSLLDKWIISRLNNLTADAAKKLDGYDITGAARSTEHFVIEDLSNWYVRRSRKRFQNPQTAKEKREAEKTLGYILFELSKLCAPFVPFLSEQIYQQLHVSSSSFVRGGGVRQKSANSVHWEGFPKSNKKYINRKLENEMTIARMIVERAHEQRSGAGIRVRQPLAELEIKKKLPGELLGVIAEEVNVKKVKYAKLPDSSVARLNTKISAQLREEGFINEFVRHVQNLRKAGGLVPKDKIELRYAAEADLSEAIQREISYIGMQNNALKILEAGRKKESFKAEGEFDWEGGKVWVGMKKI